MISGSLSQAMLGSNWGYSLDKSEGADATCKLFFWIRQWLLSVDSSRSEWAIDFSSRDYLVSWMGNILLLTQAGRHPYTLPTPMVGFPSMVWDLVPGKGRKRLIRTFLHICSINANTGGSRTWNWCLIFHLFGESLLKVYKAFSHRSNDPTRRLFQTPGNQIQQPPTVQASINTKSESIDEAEWIHKFEAIADRPRNIQSPQHCYLPSLWCHSTSKIPIQVVLRYEGQEDRLPEFSARECPGTTLSVFLTTFDSIRAWLVKRYLRRRIN